VPLKCPKYGKSSKYFVYPDELCERCWRASLRRAPAPTEQHLYSARIRNFTLVSASRSPDL
jgi:hypothetical protein